MLTTVNSELLSIPEVQSAIDAGASLFLAGSREALSQLPHGNWIGGTIPYFMADEGGLMSEDRIFVTKVPDFALEVKFADYGPDNLADLYREAPANGFTFMVLPASTDVHRLFAEQATSYDGFLFRPMVGWVTGVRVDRIGKETPAVFNGRTGNSFDARCAALHVTLPANKVVDLEIVNIFESGGGNLIRFEETGFHVSKCLVDGKPDNLAEYITRKRIPLEFPLVGDYNGSAINVSFQSVDVTTGTAYLYAPVFPGVDYHFAKPVEDYASAFRKGIAAEENKPVFACNCILNFLYGKLEGKTTGRITGPITFGEIAHLLLNQTMVQLHLRDIE
jgi:hypothetical protein